LRNVELTTNMRENMRNLTTQDESTIGPPRSSISQSSSNSRHRLDALVAMDKDILNEDQAPQAPAFGWGRRQYRPGSAPETNFLSPYDAPLYV
jgi:hypothetical protein